MIRNFFIFIFSFIPWVLASLIIRDYSYFEYINTPFFTPPKLFFPIIWFILYFLIALSITIIISTYKFKNVPFSYKLTLFINYLFNQSYTFLFFGLKNNFLGFVSCLGTFISSLFLYQESLNLNKKSTLLLIPYILFSLFATILSLTIYFMNLM